MTPFYQDDLVTLYHCDCMDFLAECQDKQFELAICDPPFGIGFDRENPSMSGGFKKDGSQRYDKTWKNRKCTGYVIKKWDQGKPAPEYFNQLLKVTQNQIIWGGNYFNLPPSGGWIVWDKKVSMPSLSKGELAWTNCNNHVEIFRFLWAGYRKDEKCKRIHPTEKPVALYRWLLQNYAKPGWTIFDSHGGSLSIAIACHDLGFKLTACEMDLDYLTAAVNRIKNYLKQPKWFKPSAPVAEQTKLF